MTADFESNWEVFSKQRSTLNHNHNHNYNYNRISQNTIKSIQIETHLTNITF